MLLKGAIFGRSLPNKKVKFSFDIRALRTKSFILCLYMKTLRAKQTKMHFAYFVQRDQLGIIAKKLT